VQVGAVISALITIPIIERSFAKFLVIGDTSMIVSGHAERYDVCAISKN
jgi:hypothetical protein